MRGGDIVRLSVGNLTRRKLRTILTLLGVIIGVGALVLMVSLGIGLKLELLKELQTEDLLRTLVVARADDSEEEGAFRGMMRPPTTPVSEEDFEEIRKIPHVTSVTPVMNLILNMKLEGKRYPMIGVAAVGPDVENSFEDFVQHGRVWKDRDAREIMLPSFFFRRAKKYKPEDVLGMEITLYKKKGEKTEFTYTIVGVVDSDRLGMMGAQLFLSLPRADELRDSTEGGLMSFGYEKGMYQNCEVRVSDARHVKEVGAVLKQRGYSVFTITDLISMINTVFLIIEGFLACIGAIGLIVALFGIANTMAMSVLERTREIGIMKALGARRGHVLKLFLLEASWIGALGGMIGLLGGFVIGFLLNWIAQGVFSIPAGTSLFHVSPWLAAGSVAFAIAVSLVAGVVPALRASRLDPVQALRHEA